MWNLREGLFINVQGLGFFRADVRRGRSPKCLFIKATATGSTINGLNDEINKPSKAGHGRAWLGLRWPGCRRWAEPQACLRARSLPAPVVLPAPHAPAGLWCHPHPMPALTQEHMIHTVVPPGTVLAVSPWHGLFLHHCQGSHPGPPPSPALKCTRFVLDQECIFILALGGKTQVFSLTRVDLAAGGGCPLEVAEDRHFHHVHPLLGLSVQFQVSGKLCFPWVTDG